MKTKRIRKWNEIRRGSKIELTKDFRFYGLNENEVGKKTMKKGFYYIVGFWADACGLSTKRNDDFSSVYIPSRLLIKFKGII